MLDTLHESSNEHNHTELCHVTQLFIRMRTSKVAVHPTRAHVEARLSVFGLHARSESNELFWQEVW